jgi:homeobox protein cut-like
MESILSERIQQKENELSARYDERLRNHHERYVLRSFSQLRTQCTYPVLLCCSEFDLQKQLKTLREQLTDLHTSNEDTQARLANASQRLGKRRFSSRYGSLLIPLFPSRS